MLLRDLPGWPPLCGGWTGTDHKFPAPGEEGVLDGVFPTIENQVTFGCAFGGHEFRCHLFVDTEETAEKITNLLSFCAGKTLKEIGNLSWTQQLL